MCSLHFCVLSYVHSRSKKTCNIFVFFWSILFSAHKLSNSNFINLQCILDVVAFFLSTSKSSVSFMCAVITALLVSRIRISSSLFSYSFFCDMPSSRDIFYCSFANLHDWCTKKRRSHIQRALTWNARNQMILIFMIKFILACAKNSVAAWCLLDKF